MNSKRIVAGGVLAGFLINLGELGLSAVAGDPAIGGAALTPVTGDVPWPVAILRGFILGLFCVLLYAALRAELRPGPRTAVTAGLLAFVFGVVFPPFAAGVNAAVPAATLLVATVGQAVLLPLATLAGAWLYQDAGPVTTGSAPATPAAAT